MDCSRLLASSARISSRGVASVSPIEDVSLNQGDLLTQHVIRSNLDKMNIPSLKRPRKKNLSPGLCDSCSFTMSAVWRKNKTQCSSCYEKTYYLDHKEEIAVRRKAYYQAHKGEKKAYYQAHKEEIAARKKACREVCGEERQAIETLTQLSSSQNIDKDHT